MPILLPGVPVAAIPAAAAPPTSAPAPAKAAQPAPENNEDEHESVDWSTLIPSVLTSTVFHIAVVLSLALYTTPEEVKKEQVIVSTVQEAPPEVDDFKEEELPKSDSNDEEVVVSDAPLMSCRPIQI